MSNFLFIFAFTEVSKFGYWCICTNELFSCLCMVHLKMLHCCLMLLTLSMIELLAFKFVEPFIQLVAKICILLMLSSYFLQTLQNKLSTIVVSLLSVLQFNQDSVWHSCS